MFMIFLMRSFNTPVIVVPEKQDLFHDHFTINVFKLLIKLSTPKSNSSSIPLRFGTGDKFSSWYHFGFTRKTARCYTMLQCNDLAQPIMIQRDTVLPPSPKRFCSNLPPASTTNSRSDWWTPLPPASGKSITTR